jgi:hypothetical protein
MKSVDCYFQRERPSAARVMSEGEEDQHLISMWFPTGRAVARLIGRLDPTAEVLLRLVQKFGKSADWILSGKS